MSDVETSKNEFLDAVEAVFRQKHSNSDAIKQREKVAGILDELISASMPFEPVLQFKRHVVNKGTRQSLVKFCVSGIDSPFWAVWPDKEGPKLTLLTDPVERCAVWTSLRGQAYQELKRIRDQYPEDRKKPRDEDVPAIDLDVLFTPRHREKVILLLKQLLEEYCSRA